MDFQTAKEGNSHDVLLQRGVDAIARAHCMMTMLLPTGRHHTKYHFAREQQALVSFQLQGISAVSCSGTRFKLENTNPKSENPKSIRSSATGDRLTIVDCSGSALLKNSRSKKSFRKSSPLLKTASVNWIVTGAVHSTALK